MPKYKQIISLLCTGEIKSTESFFLSCGVTQIGM